jgi:ribosomal protein S6--L-glutamate ligase
MPSPKTGQLQIGLLAEARYLSQNQPTGLSQALAARGHQLTLIDPQQSFYVMGEHEWLAGLDLIVGRGRSWGLLALLGWAEERDVLTINRRAAIAAVHNKARMSVALANAGLSIPQTFFGSIAQLAENIPAAAYPIILKPIFGDNSRGLLVVASPAEMAASEWPEPVALAQRYLPTDGYDLKLYGIGDEIWPVWKESPFNPRAAGETKSGLAELTPELEDLGRRCGRLFGLDLFGVDTIVTEQGPLVIEINDYPNYTGVPAGNERLADFVERRVKQ